MNEQPTNQNHTTAHDHNRRAWDRMADKGQRFTRPAKSEDLSDPLATVDGLGWLDGNVQGKRLLCLGAGGGRQSALYATAGAEVTVVDISPRMLELDREVAAERGLSVRTIETSMDDLAMFDEGEFEVIIHPVSTCYVPKIAPVYAQVARVTAPNGLYISQHKQPTSLQLSNEPGSNGRYELKEPYYRPGEPLQPVEGSRLRESGTLEYLHRWEEIIGSLCRNGFVIEDLVEPMHAKDDATSGSFEHRCSFTAPYVRIKARRTGSQATIGNAKLWIPS
jgi:SAM-dependent methyltransferase